MQRRDGFGLVSVALIVFLTGCTSTSDAPDSSPSAALSPSGASQDAAVSATCAAVSIIESSLFNARVDLERGALSRDRADAVINAAASSYESLLSFPAAQRGLRGEVGGVVSSLRPADPAASTARIDPWTDPDSSSTPDYGAAVQSLEDACAAAGDDITIFATTGG